MTNKIPKIKNLKQFEFLKISAMAAVIFLFAAKFAFAGVVINEIMYDLPGADDKHEWVEIFNDSNTEVNLSGWKFNDGSNHGLNDPSSLDKSNGGQGSLVLPVGGFAILSGDATIFLSDHVGFTGTVIDTVMSLGNATDIVKIINADGMEADSFLYDKAMGANGNGDSLQKVNGTWVAASSTPGAVNTNNQTQTSTDIVSGTQQASQTINSDQSQTSTTQSASQSQTQFSQNSGGATVSSGLSSGGTSFSTEPQIFANAGADKTGIAGADILFVGSALGLKKEPLENARYFWTFGDGATGEGKSVKHVYKYPSEYVVSLNVSNTPTGFGAALDMVNVKIIPNGLKIKEADENKIILKNDSVVILDISGWHLKNSVKIFTLPMGMFIKANAVLPLDASVVGFGFVQSGGVTGDKIELLYPNGSLAYSYQQNNLAMLEVGKIVSGSAEAGSVEKSNEIAGVASIAESSKKEAIKDNDVSVLTQKSAQEKPANKTPTLRSGQAAAIVLSQPQSSSSSFWKWFGVVAIIGLLSGGGALVLRYQKSDKEDSFI